VADKPKDEAPKPTPRPQQPTNLFSPVPAKTVTAGGDPPTRRGRKR
jgi:hypothetical protein